MKNFVHSIRVFMLDVRPFAGFSVRFHKGCKPADVTNAVYRKKLESSAEERRVYLRQLRDRQTPHEIKNRATYIRNGLGFSAADAKRLTELAEISDKRPLTDEEDNDARRLLPKYAGQRNERN